MNVQATLVRVVERLPQKRLSLAWGWLARRRSPTPLVWALKKSFTLSMGVDLTEAAEPFAAYPSLEELFVRRLRPGARRVDPLPAAVVSPVDGTVGQVGHVHCGELLQVKGLSYSLAELLADEALAEAFEGGSYATFYLAPYNYHRIHSPVAGTIERAVLVPGALRPVFAQAVELVPGLFAANERIVTFVRSQSIGLVAVVAVGAMMVGRMRMSYDDSLRGNDGESAQRRVAYDPPLAITKGGELGAFEMGSTVVVVFAKGSLELELSTGQRVRFGERIATATKE